jgi:hypothetical protein
VIYVDDISQTTSPPYATNMTRYNADLDGKFVRTDCRHEADTLSRIRGQQHRHSESTRMNASFGATP